MITDGYKLRQHKSWFIKDCSELLDKKRAGKIVLFSE
jgi:hypothetical protein